MGLGERMARGRERWIRCVMDGVGGMVMEVSMRGVLTMRAKRMEGRGARGVRGQRGERRREEEEERYGCWWKSSG